MKSLRRSWTDYKHKFLPWLLFNWKNSRVRKVKATEQLELDQPDKYLTSLTSIFQCLLDNRDKMSPSDVLFEHCGFSVSRRTSLLSGAGKGVLVDKGCIQKGVIAALYPGTVYYPMEPVFFQSLHNSFILKSLDRVLIDGNDRGISKLIYRSSAGRDMIGPYQPCDTTWLSDRPKNPLAIGQYVNNATVEFPANVCYQELDIPLDFPLQLCSYIPNVNYSSLGQRGLHVRTVLLIALRDIQKSEELLSSYLTEVAPNFRDV